MIRKDPQVVGELTARLGQLKERRQPWETHWDQMTGLFIPKIGKSNENGTSAKKRGREVYCSEPTICLKIWQAGVMGHLINPTTVWIRMTIPDKGLKQSQVVKRWLQEVEEAMYLAFNRSNFYGAMGTYIRSGGSLGTAIMISDEDVADGSIDFTNHLTRECYIAENRKGKVDTFYREFPMTLRNIIEEFGKEGLPLSMQEAASKTPYSRYTVFRGIYPGTDKAANLHLDFQKPFNSVYWLNEDQTVLREGGYDDFPVQAWRIDKNEDEEYGRSPASDSLVDAMCLNAVSKDLLRLSQFAGEPMLNVPLEEHGKFMQRPGAHHYYTDINKRVEQINTVGDMRFSMELRAELKQAIQKHFNVDFFLMMNNAPRVMTAEEFRGRQRELAILMGPQVGSLINDCLRPAIDRVFDIEMRAGRLPDIPQEVADTPGARIDYDFVGPLAQIQKQLFTMQPIQQGLMDAGPIFVQFPETRFVIDPTQLVKDIFDADGFPQNSVRSDDEIQAKIDAQEKQMAALQAAQTADLAAGAVGKASKTIEPGSGAEMAMSAMGAGQ